MEGEVVDKVVDKVEEIVDIEKEQPPVQRQHNQP